MPVHNGVGHSSATAEKQQALEAVLSMHINVVKSILSRWPKYPRPYHYIDTNAGTGYNDQEDCPGSPVVFLKTATRINVPIWARFIEINAGNRVFLDGCTGCFPGNHLSITGDNQKELPTLMDQLPRNAYGIIYCDPNGINHDHLDMLAAASVHINCKKMDILIRCAGSAVKRTQHLTGLKLLDYVSGIEKKHWLVQRVSSSDRWQWTFLLGSNWPDMPTYKKHGFIRLDSDEGKDQIERLNYTNRERFALHQPEMPYANYDEYLRHPTFRDVRQQAISRAGGT